MGKKDLKEQIDVLQRTVANGTERVKGLTIENNDLRRELMLAQRAAEVSDKSATAIAEEYLTLAETTATKAKRLIENMTTSLSVFLGEVEAVEDQTTAAHGAIPAVGHIADDAIAAEMAAVVAENKRLRKALEVEKGDSLTKIDAASYERLALITEKDLALRALTIERTTLASTRKVINRVARRLPRNWKNLLTPSSLAAALAKQAPNIAVTILAELLEIFWVEYTRMENESKEMTAESVSALVLDDSKAEEAVTTRQCFTTDRDGLHTPPSMDCNICSDVNTCVNAGKMVNPECFGTATRKGSAPTTPCELCWLYEECQNPRRTLANTSASTEA